MRWRCTPANSDADASRAMTCRHRPNRFDLKAVPRGRYASRARVSAIGGNGDPDAMATCAVVKAALAACAMKRGRLACIRTH